MQITICLQKTSAERQHSTEARRKSAPAVWPVVFFSDPRLKRDTAEFTLVKHVSRKSTKRNPGYRSRRRPKPVYGPPNYTHGTPINDYIFSGNHGISAYDAPNESSKFTPPTGSEIIVEHQPYPSGPARQRPPVSPYKHVINTAPYSNAAESFPPYRPKPVKTFGEPPPQYTQAQSPHELYVPLNSIPIQSDAKHKSPPSTSYGVPISPQSNSYRDEQPPFPTVKYQHSAPADTYGPPNYAISNYSTAYDGSNYEKPIGGNFAEPPNDQTAYDGTSGASYDSAAVPSPTFNGADYQNYRPPQTQYKSEEFLPTHQQYETPGYKEPPKYLPPVQQDPFAIKPTSHDDFRRQNFENNYDDYETFVNEAAESKKIQKSTSKQSEHFESGIGNTSVGGNIEVPSDEYVDELLRSDTVSSTTRRTTPKRRVNDRTTPAPHILDTEDLRDAFSSGSVSYPQALERPKGAFGTRIKGKTDTIKAKNFVLLSAANNRTESHHPPVIAANPSYQFGKNASARLPSVRATEGAAKNRTKSIQIISIQKSQSHSYYAGTMAPLTAKETDGFQAPNAMKFGGDGSLSVVSTNMQVGSAGDTGNGTYNEPKPMYWNGKVLPANHKVKK